MFTMMVIMALVTTALAGPLLPRSSVLMATSTVDIAPPPRGGTPTVPGPRRPGEPSAKKPRGRATRPRCRIPTVGCPAVPAVTLTGDMCGVVRRPARPRFRTARCRAARHVPRGVQMAVGFIRKAAVAGAAVAAVGGISFGASAFAAGPGHPAAAHPACRQGRRSGRAPHAAPQAKPAAGKTVSELVGRGVVDGTAWSVTLEYHPCRPPALSRRPTSCRTVSPGRRRTPPRCSASGW